MLNEDKAKFTRADKNNDGFLNETEFAAYLHPYNFDYMEDYELDRIMGEYDKDGNSFIDFEEYIGDAGIK